MRYAIPGVGLVVLVLLMMLFAGNLRGAQKAAPATPSTQAAEDPNMKKATFAAGCFWGVEEHFRQVPGVVATAVGYIGGKTEKPTYKQVCSDTTGHAEAVQVTYDPTKVSYAELLDVFWTCHNPTTLNRQGPDVGSQYRSGIFTHDDEQQKLAKASLKEVSDSNVFKKKIVTEIVPAGTFWTAEEYHQQYLVKNGGVCHPGIAKVSTKLAAEGKKSREMAGAEAQP